MRMQGFMFGRICYVHGLTRTGHLPFEATSVFSPKQWGEGPGTMPKPLYVQCPSLCMYICFERISSPPAYGEHEDIDWDEAFALNFGSYNPDTASWIALTGAKDEEFLQESIKSGRIPHFETWCRNPQQASGWIELKRQFGRAPIKIASKVETILAQVRLGE